MNKSNKRRLYCCIALFLMLTLLAVGCTNANEKQYFEQGTEVTNEDRRGGYPIVFDFDENSLGEEYAEKYNNFCKEASGVETKEQFLSDEFYRNSQHLIAPQGSSHTLKSVDEVPSATQVVYFNGRKRLDKGEILVHKWTYYSLLAKTFGFYIDDDLAKKILDSDDVLPKYIALLECNCMITDLGISVDYYGYSPVLDEKIGKKEMPIMLCEREKYGFAEAEYKEYVVAGYYIDEADYDYLDVVYDKEQFSSLLEFPSYGGFTEDEKAIRKKLDEIGNAFYIR